MVDKSVIGRQICCL